MASTTVQQTRTAIKVSGVDVYRINVEVTAAGDLPTKAIFVVEINDSTDPKLDDFARVASVADLTNVTLDRPTAVAGGDDLYRVSSWIFDYPDIETANYAQDTLKGFIDDLIKGWRIYAREFEVTTEITEHPQPDLTNFASLEVAYCTALSDETDAKDDFDAALETYTDAQTAATTAGTNVTSAQTRKDDADNAVTAYNACLAALNSLNGSATSLRSASGTYKTAGDTFGTAAKTFRDAATGTPPSAGEKTTFDNAKTAFDGAGSTQTSALNIYDSAKAILTPEISAANGAHLTTLTNMAAALAAELTSAQSAKTTADTLVQTTLVTYTEAEIVYEKAQEKTEAALAAVRALDPTWDPADADCSST